MNLSIFSYSLVLSLLISTNVLMAQIKKDPQGTDTNKKQGTTKGAIKEEIEVIRPYKPVLGEAVKIRINPNLNNNPTFKPTLNYTVLDKTLKLDSNINKLQAQKLVKEEISSPTSNYLKFAAGNLNTTLGELYINNGKDESLQTGLFIKHLAQKGSLTKQQFSKQEASAFGRIIGKQATLSGEANYSRRETYFYGFDPALVAPSTQPNEQRFDQFEIKADFGNNYNEFNYFKYKLGASAYTFNDLLNAKENAFISTGSINQVIDKFNFGLGVGIDLTHSKDIISINNYIFRANPHVEFQTNNVMLDIGLNIVQEFGSKRSLNIFPMLAANIPLASSYVSLFAGIRGDVIKNNLKDLTAENPYLNQNISLANTKEKINIYGGIKGNAGPTLGFKATGFYKLLENMQLFKNSTSNTNRFDVFYDMGKSSIFGVEAELEVKAWDIFSIIGKAQANTYEMATEIKAWLKPTYRFVTITKAKVTSKLTIDAEITLNGKTYAKVIHAGPIPLTTEVKVNSYTDISAGAEYQVAPKTKLYIRATNILGTSYERYLHYTNLGLGIFGGFTYSF